MFHRVISLLENHPGPFEALSPWKLVNALVSTGQPLPLARNNQSQNVSKAKAEKLWPAMGFMPWLIKSSSQTMAFLGVSAGHPKCSAWPIHSDWSELWCLLGLREGQCATELTGHWELASLTSVDSGPRKMQLGFRQVTLCRFPEVSF